MKAKKIAQKLISGPCFIPVFITDETGKKAKYTVRLEDSGTTDLTVTLEPYGPGSTARAHGMINYAYDKGGSMFKAAVDFAREIESHIPKEKLL